MFLSQTVDRAQQLSQGRSWSHCLHKESTILGGHFFFCPPLIAKSEVEREEGENLQYLISLLVKFHSLQVGTGGLNLGLCTL